MTNPVEIDYIGDGELYAVVCRPPSGKTFIHLSDEPHNVHGEEPVTVTPDETAYIPVDRINDVDA